MLFAEKGKLLGGGEGGCGSKPSSQELLEGLRPLAGLRGHSGLHPGAWVGRQGCPLSFRAVALLPASCELQLPSGARNSSSTGAGHRGGGGEECPRKRQEDCSENLKLMEHFPVMRCGLHQKKLEVAHNKNHSFIRSF